jgi:hypothetical protein
MKLEFGRLVAKLVFGRLVVKVEGWLCVTEEHVYSVHVVVIVVSLQRWNSLSDSSFCPVFNPQFSILQNANHE